MFQFFDPTQGHIAGRRNLNESVGRKLTISDRAGENLGRGYSRNNEGCGWRDLLEAVRDRDTDKIETLKDPDSYAHLDRRFGDYGLGVRRALRALGIEEATSPKDQYEQDMLRRIGKLEQGIDLAKRYLQAGKRGGFFRSMSDARRILQVILDRYNDYDSDSDSYTRLRESR